MFFLFRKEDLLGVCLGVFATFGQVILTRESFGLSGGNELTVGLSLASWLCGVGLGSFLSSRLKNPRRWVFAGSLGAPWLLGTSALLLRLHRTLLGPLPGSDPTLVQLVTLIFLCLLMGGFSVGFLFTSRARASGDGSGKPVSRLYIAEAFGALAGGILFAFVFSVRLRHLECLGIAGALLLGAIVPLGIGRLRAAVAGGASLLLCILVIGGVLKRLDDGAENASFSNLIASGKLVARGYSHYGRLTLGRAQDQFFVLSDGRLDHVFPDPWDRPFSVHVAMSQHIKPERVLLIGGGPSDRLQAVLAHGPREVVLTVMDDGIHDMCAPYWSGDVRRALRDPRVQLIVADGRDFVSKTDKRFDVVIVASEPIQSGGASRYHTREFFLAVKRVLRPGGIIATATPGGANVLAPEAGRVTASERKTLASVFPEVVAIPGEVVTFFGAVNVGSLTEESEELERRFFAHGAGGARFSPRRFYTILDKNRTADLDEQLQKWSAVPMNTDMRPTAYLSGLELWERRLSREGAAGDGTWLGWAKRWAWAAFLFPVITGLLWMLWSRGRNFGPPSFAIATTGAAGMAMEVAVLYVFQASSGQLYSGIALLVAVFMAGLGAGAYLSQIPKEADSLFPSIVVEICVLLLLVAMGPVLEIAFASPRLLWAWSLVSGMVTGAAFPILLGRAARARGKDERRVAGLMESADHYGAAFGALVTGVLWLPVYGVVATGLFFATLKGVSLGYIVFLGVRNVRT